MNFIKPNIETFLSYLQELNPKTPPRWGKMSAQRMIEHLCDNLYMAIGKGKFKLVIPEEKVEKMQAFLNSPKPMAKDIKVYFAPEEYSLRNSNLKNALIEFQNAWRSFEDHFNQYPNDTTIHPFYGQLTKELWLKLIAKHFTHHFEQFNLIDSKER